MSEPTPDAIVPSAPPDVLQLANAESLAYVAWCQEQLAAKNHLPQLPPKPWAGRDDLVNQCARYFKTSIELASNAVDQAVIGMWVRAKDDPSNFRKQAMRLELQSVKMLIYEAMKNGRSEQTFKYEPHKDDPMKLIEMKVKEKRYKGVDMGQVAQLLSVIRSLMVLDGLEGDAAKDSGNVIEMVFDKLDKLKEKNQAAEDEEQTAITSRALRAKTRKLDGKMTAKQVRILTGIVKPSNESDQPQVVEATVVSKRRGKAITVTDVELDDDEKDDDDDDDEAADE